MHILLTLVSILKMLETIKVLWVVIKLSSRIYKTYFDNDPLSSAYRTKVLHQAMEAVDEGDLLKLNAAIDYFGRVSKSKSLE